MALCGGSGYGENGKLPRLLRDAGASHVMAPTTNVLKLWTDQRKSARTTLDRFNARLNVPAETVDTQELRQLVISDRFLSSILESTFDAVILVDQSGGVAAFNPSADRLFERSQKQVLSHQVISLSIGSWASDLQAAFQPHRQETSIHSTIETGNGSKSVEVSATPLYDRSQNLLATLLIVPAPLGT